MTSTVLVVIVAVAALIYWDATNWNWQFTGFGSKTVWDWLDLLLVPLILAGGGLWFSWYQKQTELQIAQDQSRQAALTAYLDHMTMLLLTNGLHSSSPQDEVRAVARARTLAVLRQLDPERKGNVLRFLYEADLIIKERTVIDLVDANLSGSCLDDAILDDIYLRAATLDGAIFKGAVLDGAVLRGANLNGANLDGATLFNASLDHAWLKGTSLCGTILTNVNLMGATLTGALYNTSTRWPEGFDPKSAGALLKDD